MRIVLVSGIWPPDPGGPASHAPALAEFLVGRGHGVEVVTTATAAPAVREFPVRWVDRRSPVRHARVALLVRECARRADVVYATSMIRRAALGTRFARRPLLVKLTTDEVFERMRRRGRFEGSLADFQRERGARIGLLRATRDAALRRAHHVFCPSAYLRSVALGWRVDPARISVLPNPAPPVPELPLRAELRAELGLDGQLLAFAGRLVPAKGLDLALAAVAEVPSVTLAIAGEGPERARLEARAQQLELGQRARFLGALTREGVLRLFGAADASLLSSGWENFPHTVVEALAVGCPVIATSVGGVPEVVRDGENGLLVPPGDVDALASAIGRFFSDGELRVRLAAAAPSSVAGHTEKAVFSAIEAELERATGR